MVRTLISLEIVLLSLIVIISLNSYINSALLPLIGSLLIVDLNQLMVNFY